MNESEFYEARCGKVKHSLVSQKDKDRAKLARDVAIFLATKDENNKPNKIKIILPGVISYLDNKAAKAKEISRKRGAANSPAPTRRRK